MGGKFWLGLIAGLVALGIGCAIVFMIVGAAFSTWGIFGTLLLICAVMLLIGWIYDRRKASERPPDEYTTSY